MKSLLSLERFEGLSVFGIKIIIWKDYVLSLVHQITAHVHVLSPLFFLFVLY